MWCVRRCPATASPGRPLRRAWTPRRMAAASLELMSRLGYERFGAQGGDWGAMVTAQMALGAPERLTGIHLNLAISPEPPPGAVRELTEEELADRAEGRASNRVERGYREQQATRPQSLSVGLNDSPAGLAAWIVEKFLVWSDIGPDNDIETSFTKDDLLTNVMVYWVTGTIASANRLYYETRVGGRGSFGPRPAGGGAHRLCPLPRRRHPTGPAVGGVLVQHRPLDRDAPWRPLRLPRGPRSLHRRRDRLLRLADLISRPVVPVCFGGGGGTGSWSA